MNIYISASRQNSKLVREALEILSKRINIQILQADYLNVEELIVSQIIDIIKKADLVIADITSESPNIYYEVGIAHSIGKPVILVSQTNNFNKLPLLSYRFFNYETNYDGIKKLSLWLEQILFNKEELKKLNPITKNNNILDYKESIEENRLDKILNISGSAKYYELENWLYTLLKDIPGFDVQYNVSRNGAEYDFILWNSNESEELKSLGNPIPIEIKAYHRVDKNLFHSLIGKATIQGFKSLILIRACWEIMFGCKPQFVEA